MRAVILAACLSTIAAAGARAASLTFYTTRAAFDQVVPGVPIQSFDSANLSGQSYVTQPSPLSWATNDGVFSKGSILPGLKIRTLHPGAVSSALIVNATGPVGATSVGNNWFGDVLVLRFTAGASAVGEDVYGNTGSSSSFAGRITERVFSGTKLLGAKTLNEAAGASVFFGVSSASASITSIELSWSSDNDASTYVSNIAFGSSRAR